MKLLLMILLSVALLATPVSALEIEAPPVPKAGQEWMPEKTDSLSEGLGELTRKALTALRPDLKEAAEVSTGILAAAILICVLQSFSDGLKLPTNVVGSVTVASLLLMNANAMIRLGTDTIRQMADYGKLLLPVMTAALAAQGGVTASGALYAGTAAFSAILNELITSLMLPGIYFFLALYTGNCATGTDMLKRMADALKGAMIWTLKLLLMVFTSYLGLTGVVSGTTDAAALKAAKVTMSSFVPVVGGVLSDASEAVLVSAGLMKNAAGIYGILAVLALFLHPFLQIASHYLMLKLTAALCSILGDSKLNSLTDAFASAMGILLGTTGAVCVTVLISTVCFMRGVG